MGTRKADAAWASPLRIVLDKPRRHPPNTEADTRGADKVSLTKRELGLQLLDTRQRKSNRDRYRVNRQRSRHERMAVGVSPVAVSDVNPSHP